MFQSEARDGGERMRKIAWRTFFSRAMLHQFFLLFFYSRTKNNEVNCLRKSMNSVLEQRNEIKIKVAAVLNAWASSIMRRLYKVTDCILFLLWSRLRSSSVFHFNLVSISLNYNNKNKCTHLHLANTIFFPEVCSTVCFAQLYSVC